MTLIAVHWMNHIHGQIQFAIWLIVVGLCVGRTNTIIQNTFASCQKMVDAACQLSNERNSIMVQFQHLMKKTLMQTNLSSISIFKNIADRI